MPVTLDTRPPMFAGPMLRQRKPARRVESSVIPLAPAAATPVVTATLLGGGFWGGGSGRALAVAVDVGVDCGGGAGGFWYTTCAVATERTAAAAYRRWFRTA